MLVLIQAQTTFANRMLQAIVITLLLVQYVYLFSAATLLPPTAWNTLLGRLFVSYFPQNSGCSSPIPPESPDTEIAYHVNCNMTFDICNQYVFRWMGGGIQRMNLVERRMLFERLDMNNDGILRWDEFSMLWTPTNATPIRNVNLVDVNQPIALLRIHYFAEVYSRVKSYTDASYGVGGFYRTSLGRKLFGNGVGQDRPFTNIF
ncbi:hypothetical protein BCR33DRAFT_711849 [Rhizoclosmatium globosum]|uniref:EF-hand domain-containing protein n=1 Tax=Rhizoclosmatium globosum TaxID=329046 RepID=A0A1Y2CZX1_9FUNG|nr:hypothetical protein BCR33DRAFT_711849 [Rhizoclosmatium globosum]|eukprot:ORY52568.1 hypothetical protein BCR33DRAFT_711849 [Rhizoclosmatium globosum]